MVDAAIRAKLRSDNLVILLDAAPETIHRRLSQSRRGERRPLLEGGDPLARIRGLKADRESVYQEAAHQVFVTDAWAPDQVADQLAARVRRLLAGQACPPARIERRFPAGSAEYLSVVGHGAALDLARYLDEVGLSGRVRLISDDIVARAHASRIRRALETAGRPVSLLTFPPGERTKTLASAERAYGWLIREGTDRGDVIVALGGGVVGDLAGFVAATFLRGLPLVHVPSSLLAMVDSSIGGKVGINHRLGKNLIGAFHQPRLVIADTQFLETLPPRELAAGWAEVVKTGMILDEELFAHLDADPSGLITVKPQLVATAIARTVELKALVVAEDERETGRRMVLNYGHTIGHAIEAATGYERYLHGEAVAIGMHAAASMSVALGLLSSEEAGRQDALLTCLGLPLSLTDVQPADLWAPMRRDKKARRSQLHWVLPDSIGHAVVRDDVPESLVNTILGGLLAGTQSQTASS